MSDVPDHIGRYRIEAVLARGAMGVVYMAHDPEIDRKVAIKLIRADLLASEERADYLVRFRREAQAAGRCAHPNIVAIYDFAVHDGNPFLAMELVDGVTLARASARGVALDPQEAVRVTLQVLDALGAAHAMGIVHRDIKPANIILRPDGLVKVTDFGISRLDSSELTQDGAVIGTPSYMSPEQCRGEASDARSDLFSLGTVLYELLCGERAFAGRSAAETMQRLLRDDPPDLRERSVAVTPALKAVVDRALAKRPEQRFATAGEMAAALRSATQSRLPARADDDATKHAAPAAASWLDSDTAAFLRRMLAPYVGPIAGVMVQSAARTPKSAEALCEALARGMEREPDRTRFRAEVLPELRRRISGPGGAAGTLRPATATLSSTLSASIPAPELEAAQRELARYLGPIARVLVKRASGEALSADDFWSRLAKHIERDDERRRFLASRQR